MVKILYFARLKETLGMGSEEIPLPEAVRTLGELRAALILRGGDWARVLAAASPIRAAVNQAMATDDTPIKSGDEIAFFPPVTGG
jgi:molybdopterin synthase sulfur carrier subunit